MRSINWLAVLAPAVLSGCNTGGEGRYPQAVKTNFVNACTGGGAPRAVCDCMFAEIEKKVPYDKFLEQDTKAREGGQPDADFQKVMSQAAATCIRPAAT